MSKKEKKIKEKKPTDKLADKTLMTKILQGIFGDAQKKTLVRYAKKAIEINKLEEKYQKMSDKELAEQTDVLRKKLAKLTKTEQNKAVAEKVKAKKSKKSGKNLLKKSEDKVLDELLADAFAIVREATNRKLKMRHFDVQLIGGMALHEGNVAEMKTGEGKTLVALLPSYLNALSGKGVHVVTVNDYLAQRDAGWNGPVFDFLGMKVGVIIAEASFIYDKDYINEEHEDERFRHLKPCSRKEAYAADVTYGTTYTLPTLSYATGVSGITYESTNEEVATIDASGNVTINNVNGTTIIKAVFAGDDGFKPSTATYTLNVSKAFVVEDGVFDFTYIKLHCPPISF